MAHALFRSLSASLKYHLEDHSNEITTLSPHVSIEHSMSKAAGNSDLCLKTIVWEVKNRASEKKLTEGYISIVVSETA